MLLWLTGAPGSGKSATAWEVFTQTPGLGFVDVDQVGMLYPENESDECGYRLKTDAIRSLAPNYTQAGASHVLVSGVADPRPDGLADRFSSSEARYLLLTVEDEVLRQRILERGWDASDAHEIVAEQVALAASGFAGSTLDTTGLTVSAVAHQVKAELLVGPECFPVHPDEAQGTPQRSVFITGPRAGGCSTVGFATARRSWSAGTPTGFADLAQLSYLRLSESAMCDHDLGITNVGVLASVFSRWGAERFIGNGHLCRQEEIDSLRAHLPGVLVVRLRAQSSQIQEHIRARFGGNETRLTGEDLAVADADYQQVVLQHALEQQKQMDRDGVGDLTVDVADKDADAIAEEILQAL